MEMMRIENMAIDHGKVSYFSVPNKLLFLPLSALGIPQYVVKVSINFTQHMMG